MKKTLLLLALLTAIGCQKEITVTKGIGYVRILNMGYDSDDPERSMSMDFTAFSGISIVAHEVVPENMNEGIGFRVIKLPEGEYSFAGQWRKDGMIFTDGCKGSVTTGDTLYIRLTPY